MVTIVVALVVVALAVKVVAAVAVAMAVAAHYSLVCAPHFAAVLPVPSSTPLTVGQVVFPRLSSVREKHLY